MFLFSSAFNSISYLIFVVALWWLYIIQHCKQYKYIKHVLSCFSSYLYVIVHCKKREEEEEDIKPLHPFDNELPKYPNEVHSNNNLCQGNDCAVCKLTRNQDNDTTTRQDPKTFILYIIALVVYTLIIGVMESVATGKFFQHPPAIIDDNTNGTKPVLYMKLEKSAMVAFIYSYLCTIVSCFIFSKIMYGIQTKCMDLYKYLDHVKNFCENEAAINEYLGESQLDQTLREKKILLYLKKRDKDFTDVAVKTLQPLQFWFLFHWIAFILISFLSVDLFFQVIHLTSTNNFDKQFDNFGFRETIVLIPFGALSLFLFIYPSIRAAKVTKYREKLIRTITCDNFENVSDNVKNNFIAYLKAKKFGFRLHIICITIPFSITIAYVSIVLGLFGFASSIAAAL